MDLKVFRRSIVCLSIIAVVCQGIAFSNPVTVTTTVGVSVPRTLSLTYWIQSVPAESHDPYGTGSADVTQEGMNFGDLAFQTHDNMNIFTATKYFTVFFIPDSPGGKYRLTQTCTGIVNGASNLNRSIVMTPDYNPGDCFKQTDGTCTPQLGHDPRDSVGPKALAVGANRIIWDCRSGTVGGQIMRCYYGVSTGAADELAINAKPVVSDTLSGTYRGTITFSMVED